MFSYVDKKIREKLEQDSRLVHLDQQGRPVSSDDPEQPFISILGPIPLPRLVGGREHVFSWYPFVHRLQLRRVLDSAARVPSGGEEAFRSLLQSNLSVNSVLGYGAFGEMTLPPVRVHSCCITSEVFGSLRCDCGPQLEAAFRIIVEEGGGAVVYMTGHEGRGIGLWAKAVTYLLQDDGQDTYRANVSLGLPEDSRDFTDTAVVLRYLLKGRPIRLLSNNPLKREHLVRSGQPVAEMVSHLAGLGRHNLRYLRSKKEKGHSLPDL